MPYLQRDEVKLHYLRLADGEGGMRPDHLVMVHGLAANLAFWYVQLAPRFAQRFDVLLFDLRGHGRSGRPAAGYTPAAMAGDLAALLDHAGIEQVHLVGHSFGGLVALAFTLAQPQRVASLVLADVHVGFIRRRQRLADWRLWPRLERRLRQLGVELRADEPEAGLRLLEVAARVQVEQPHRAAELQGLLSPFTGRAGARSAAQWLDLLEQTSLRRDLAAEDGVTRERLADLHKPTLIVYGEYSQALPSGQLLHHLWPHAQFEIVPGAGHFFPASRPETLARAAERFWSGLR